MTHELSQEQYLGWELTPLQMVGGIEVFEHMKVFSDQGDRSIEQIYISERAQLMNDRLVINSVSARSQMGKGGLFMGFNRLFKSDQFLNSWAGDNGVNILIQNVPFAHCAEAAKLEKVGLVPPHFHPGTYTREHTMAISGLQRNIASEVLPKGISSDDELRGYLIKNKLAIVIQAEESAPISFPVTDTVPVEIEGEFDLGNSTGYNFALDSITRPFVRRFLGIRDERVEQDPDVVNFRIQVNSDNPDLAAVFGGATKVVVTRFVNGQIEEVEAKDLPEREQRQLVAILRKSMAPREAVVRNDLAVDKTIATLYEKGEIPSPTDLDYFMFIIKRLALPSDQVEILNNRWFGGRKTYDLDYLLNNAVVRRYPELLEV